MSDTFVPIAKIKNLSSVIKDVLAGDESAYTKYLTKEKVSNIKKAFNFIVNYPDLTDIE